MREMQPLGRHIIVEYNNCEAEILNNVSEIESIMKSAAQRAGATVINTTFHHFSPWGVSGVVVIQESHLSIHTWPEYGYASVDLFTCGDSVNPWIAFQYLKEKLKAKAHSAVEMLRGQAELLEKTGFQLQPSDFKFPENTNPAQLTRDVWFTERTHNFAFSVKHNGGFLERKKTPFQQIEVYQTPSLGKMLVLDGAIVLTENDEFAYHEMLVQVAMFSHRKAKNILIIGGGDGGAAREVLKHQEVKKVTLIEVDKAIISTAKKHFSSALATLENPKIKLIVTDAWDFIKNNKIEKYDIIFIDLGQPTSADDPFYSKKFYKKVTRLLNDKGILISQIGSPMLNKELFKTNFRTLKSLSEKGNVNCYLAQIPTYPSGTCGFGFYSKNKISHKPISKKSNQLSEMELRYYNKKVHQAAFALPNFVLDYLGL